MAAVAKVLSLDIREKSFSTKAFGGYSQSEVKDYMMLLSEEFLKISSENRMLREQNEDKSRELDKLRDLENVLLRQHQDTETQIKRVAQQAQKEARLTISRATIEAEKIMEEAKRKANAIYSEMKADCEFRMKEMQLEFDVMAESFREVDAYTASLMEEMKRFVADTNEKLGTVAALKANRLAEQKLKSSQELLKATLENSQLDLDRMMKSGFQPAHYEEEEVESTVDINHSIENAESQRQELPGKGQPANERTISSSHQKASTPLTNLEKLRLKQRKPLR